MISTQNSKLLSLSLTALFLLMLAACQPTPEPTTAPTTPPEIELPTAAPTQPIAPAFTEIPTEAPSSADIVVLVNDADSAAVQAAYGPLLQTISAESGLSLEFQTTLLASALQDNTKAVILFTVPPNLNALLTHAAGTVFTVVGEQPQTQAENLVVLPGTDNLEDELAFTAGYLSGVLEYEYRIGIIDLQTDAAYARAASFRMGAEFYCGLCNPVHPPYVNYPVSVVLPVEDAPNTLTALDALLAESVRLVYVSPDITNPEVLNMIAISGLKIIGAQSQAAHLGENLLAAADLNQTAILDQTLRNIISGNGPTWSSSPIVLTPYDDEAASAGRLNHVQEMVVELLQGFYQTEIE